MQVGVNEIDPRIAQALIERLCAPLPEFLREDIYWGGLLPWRFNWQFHTGGLILKRRRPPTEAEKRAYALRKRREEQFALRVVTTFLASLLIGTAGAAGLDFLHASGAQELLVGGGLWAAGTGWGVWKTRLAMPISRLRKQVSLEEMKAVFPLLSLTRAERIYCDTLELLARMEVAPEADVSIRDTLRQINDLLRSSREIDMRKQSLLPVLGANVVHELQEEYGALGRRLDTVTDAVTRQSLERSLQMCQTRLQNALAFEQGLERLNAQSEAITQTLSTVQSALVRAQVAPEPLHSFVAEEIAATVAQMNQQTYAVEKAVQEVMTLNATQ